MGTTHQAGSDELPHDSVDDPVAEAAMVDDLPHTDGVVDLVAEVAMVDRRSVIKHFAGLKVPGSAGRRIDAAIAHLKKEGE